MANVNNYIRAGNAAVRKAVAIRKTLADNKTDFGALGQESIRAAAQDKAAIIASNAKVAKAATNAAANIKLTNIEIERDKSIANSERSARKAGKLAGGAALLGIGAMKMRQKTEPNEMLGSLMQQMGTYDSRIEDLKIEAEKIRAAIKKPTSVPANTKPDEVSTISTQGIPGQSDGWKRISKVIRTGEGTLGDRGYTTMFTGPQFTDMSKHPEKIHTSGNLESDAAGAYQFLSTTYNPAAKALGITDFTPESQEKVGKYLAQRRGFNTDTVFTDKASFLKELDKIAPEWASMPTLKTGTSYYGQGGLTPDEAWRIYSAG